MNIFYSLGRTRTCACQGIRNVPFTENLLALFSCNTRFEIRPFALLPTSTGMNISMDIIKVYWSWSEQHLFFFSVTCNLAVYSHCFRIIKYYFLGSIWNGIVTGLLTSTYTYFSTCHYGLSWEVSQKTIKLMTPKIISCSSLLADMQEIWTLIFSTWQCFMNFAFRYRTQTINWQLLTALVFEF